MKRKACTLWDVYLSGQIKPFVTIQPESDSVLTGRQLCEKLNTIFPLRHAIVKTIILPAGRKPRGAK
jgi:hypothetical protein